MTDGGQAGLGEFGGGDARPAAEAAAVAGSSDATPDAVTNPKLEHLPNAEGSVSFAVMQVDYTISRADGEERPIVHAFGRTPDGEAVRVDVVGFRPYFYAPTDSIDERDLGDDRITGSAETDENGDRYQTIRGTPVTRIYGRTPRDVGAVREQFDHYEADILFPNRFLIDNDVKSGIRVPDRPRSALERAGNESEGDERESGDRDAVERGAVDGDERWAVDGPAASDGANGSSRHLLVHADEVESAAVDAAPRVHTMDLEVDDRSGFPEEGEEPIVCLATHDSTLDEYGLWIFEGADATARPPDRLDGYDPIEGEDLDVEIRAFESEAAMLEDYLAYVERTDPDVLTGWNFEDFDAPYLLDRLDRLDARHPEHDLSIERLSRVDEVWRSDWGGPDIKGRVVFDLLYAYRQTVFSELDSYRLDAVGESELGVGKERYPGDIGDLWEEDPERLLEYNLRDVEICVELDRQQEIVAFWDEVRQFVGCKLEDAPTAGDAVDMYLLHKVHGRYVLPSKGRVEEGEEFEGGAVFEPVTGVKENVSVLDLKSLYPMCMVTINASPETKVDPDAYDGETYRSPNGIHFRKDPPGVIREMVDELLTEREEKKALRDEHEPGNPEYEQYDRQQASVKVIMNSLYGVSGWVRFRLYDKDAASAVTATGREVIRFTERAANELDYEVTYGDTDSVMLSLGQDVPKAAAIAQSFEIESYLNDRYDDFAREELNAEAHRFEIEFEKLYRRFFQAGKKKRYAGHIVWKEGKDVDDVDVTGFEYKRSDIAPITKEVQHRVLEMIVREGDLEAVKSYLNEVIEEFLAGEYGLEAVAIPGGIGKRLDNYETDTAHVRGAKYANAMLGTTFQRGSKPKRLYLEGVHPEFWRHVEDELGLDPQRDEVYGEFKRNPDVICFEYEDQIPDAFDVDWEKMLDKTLKGPIARILEALDVSWEEVKSGQEQTGLGSFV